MPEVVWGPATTGFLMLAVGVLGLAVNQPWLFPSLGPTAFVQADFPGRQGSMPYHTIVGHCTGIGAGYAAVFAVHANSAPAVTGSAELASSRVFAGAIAIALTVLGMLLLRASHPPAASTALLIALGAFRTTLHDAGVLVAGVLLIAVLGELVRRVRLRYSYRYPPTDAQQRERRDKAQ